MCSKDSLTGIKPGMLPLCGMFGNHSTTKALCLMLLLLKMYYYCIELVSFTFKCMNTSYAKME